MLGKSDGGFGWLHANQIRRRPPAYWQKAAHFTTVGFETGGRVVAPIGTATMWLLGATVEPKPTAWAVGLKSRWSTRSQTRVWDRVVKVKNLHLSPRCGGQVEVFDTRRESASCALTLEMERWFHNQRNGGVLEFLLPTPVVVTDGLMRAPAPGETPTHEDFTRLTGRVLRAPVDRGAFLLPNPAWGAAAAAGYPLRRILENPRTDPGVLTRLTDEMRRRLGSWGHDAHDSELLDMAAAPDAPCRREITDDLTYDQIREGVLAWHPYLEDIGQADLSAWIRSRFNGRLFASSAIGFQALARPITDLATPEIDLSLAEVKELRC